MAVWKKINSTLRVLLITIVVLTVLGIVLVLVAYSLPVIISLAVIGLTIFVVMLLTYEEDPDEDN
jgi:multisubunit Na+/H+ antiporter MnhC subunit